MTADTLSKRLQAVYRQVPKSDCAADVGCDHALLAIALVAGGVCSYALACDLRPGPLAAAAVNIKAAGLEDRIETRLSDGLQGLRAGEADCAVMAGMGGLTIREILMKTDAAAIGLRTLVLAPQSEVAALRAYLRENGMRITDESMVREQDHFYPVLRVWLREGRGILPEQREETGERRMSGQGGTGSVQSWDNAGASRSVSMDTADRYGPVLLEKRDPVLLQFLLKEKERYDTILERLSADGQNAGARLLEIRRECACIREAMELYDDVPERAAGGMS